MEFPFADWLSHESSPSDEWPEEWYLGRYKDLSKRRYCTLCQFVCSVAKIAIVMDERTSLSRAVVSFFPWSRSANTLAVRLSFQDSFKYFGRTRPTTVSRFQILFGEELPSKIGVKGSLYTKSRKISLGLDFRMIKSWISDCYNNHEHPLEYTRVHVGRPNKAKVIDVETMHISDATEDCRYIALSYVWGGISMDMMQEVWKKGSGYLDLKPILSKLPATIKDAISVVKNLGERYIWIDSICIDQCSESDKAHQIGQMDRIYSSAILTIVAATGKDANQGLPGLSGKDRFPFQIEQSTGPYMLRTIFLNDKAHGIIETSPWSERGWTYQERLLSKRLLFFTNHQVYFQCRLGIWSEDTTKKVQQDDLTEHFLQNLQRSELNFSRRRLLDHPFELFVYELSNRKFKYESDKLRASLAALKLLSSSYQSPMLWGLPERGFEMFLLWTYEYSKTQYAGSLNDLRTVHGFPTWSWASCSVQTSCIDYNRSPTVQSLVTFYKLLHDGNLEKMDNGALERYELEKAQGWEDSREWRAEQYQHPDIDLEIYSAGKIPGELSTGILVFWTISVSLVVKYDPDAPQRKEQSFLPFAVFDETRDKLSTDMPMALPRKWWASQTQSTFSFIAIAQGPHPMSDSQKEFGKGMMLFMVQWQGHVASRMGLVWIPLTKWERLQEKTWKLIHLG
ncbi:HET-domain-containing protein [Corynespora cassiicola Philippines]|uniref:HET-domain-containing protein n=1 Tax=Corynespora cassiicola Philippines TaxID=1448308 RepID=A0A2T2NNC2_CORCC|nr:HET-domain-containing protein [Corynespora cassiicola Philippines]